MTDRSFLEFLIAILEAEGECLTDLLLVESKTRPERENARHAEEQAAEDTVPSPGVPA